MSALSIITQQSNATCYGAANGFAYVVIRGGQAPYVIRWYNSDSDLISSNISARGLVAGEYRVIVNDSVAASGADTIEITQPAYEAPIPEIGMSLCSLHNCFLPMAACRAGNLGYKYFSQYPNEGIECNCEQEKVVWLNNAIEILQCWNPEGTEIESGMQFIFSVLKPSMSCGAPPNTLTITASLISSVDGEIATFPATNYDTTDPYNEDIINYFFSIINNIPNYALEVSGTDITVTQKGSKYVGGTLTLTMEITELTTCTITDPDWTVTGDGGTYSDEETGTVQTITTGEPCIDEEQAGNMIETMKTILADCSIRELKEDLITF